MDTDRSADETGDMDDTPPFQHPVSETIRARAMSFPDAVEGSSCVNRAFSAGGKNFVFYGEKADVCTLRLKLATGWTKVEVRPDDPPPLAEVEDWMTESFLLLVPKKIQSKLDR